MDTAAGHRVAWGCPRRRPQTVHPLRPPRM